MTRDFYVKQMILSQAASSVSNSIDDTFYSAPFIMVPTNKESPPKNKDIKVSYFVLIGDGGVNSNNSSETDINDDGFAYIRL